LGSIWLFGKNIWWRTATAAARVGSADDERSVVLTQPGESMHEVGTAVHKTPERKPIDCEERRKVQPVAAPTR
jgi:hypothetical protein